MAISGEITVEVYAQLYAGPHNFNKVIDMVAQLSKLGMVDKGWVDVAYPLYYWPLDLSDSSETSPAIAPTIMDARTYVLLAKALATALLLALDASTAGGPDHAGR